MKKLHLLFVLLIGILSCENPDNKELNQILTDVKGTWYMKEIHEVIFPNLPSNEKLTAPLYMSVTFKSCDYKNSGNKCLATFKLNNHQEFDMEYNVGKTGNGEVSFGFIYPYNLKLPKSDSLFVHGGWNISKTEVNKITIAQRHKIPLYDMVIVR